MSRSGATTGYPLPAPSGSSDSSAIAAALAAVPSGTTLFAPRGATYLADSGLTLPEGRSLDLTGATIKATAGMASLLDTPLGTPHIKGSLRGGTLDANGLAQDALVLRRFQAFRVTDLNINNPTRHGIVAGDTAAAVTSYELALRGVRIERPQSAAVPAGSYGLWTAYATDGDHYEVGIIGFDVGVRNDQGGNGFALVHPWGYSGKNPSICFDDNAAGTDWIGCVADTPTVNGWRLRKADSKVIGGRVFNGPFGGLDNVLVGVLCDTAYFTLVGIHFAGNDATHRILKAIDWSGSGRPNSFGHHYDNVTTAYTESFGVATNVTGLSARNASLLEFFAANGGSREVGFANNAKMRGYTDNYVTETWRIDSATGAITARKTTTALRPSAATVGQGGQVFDTTLGKPIWSDGANWRDSAGTVV